jgi:uncharacterized protein (TIGR04255 family)
VDKLNRLGWRYVNVIPFQRERGVIPLRQFLAVELSFPEPLSDKLRTIDAKLQIETPSGLARIHLASIDHKERPGVEALLLDLDTSTERPDLRIANCINEIEVLRKEGRRLFEDMITDDYRTYLRGETL